MLLAAYVAVVVVVVVVVVVGIVVLGDVVAVVVFVVVAVVVVVVVVEVVVGTGCTFHLRLVGPVGRKEGECYQRCTVVWVVGFEGDWLLGGS